MSTGKVPYINNFIMLNDDDVYKHYIKAENYTIPWEIRNYECRKSHQFTLKVDKFKLHIKISWYDACNYSYKNGKKCAVSTPGFKKCVIKGVGQEIAVMVI